MEVTSKLLLQHHDIYGQILWWYGLVFLRKCMTFHHNDCWIPSLSHPNRRYRLRVCENRGLRRGNIILRTKLRNRCSTGIITGLKRFRKVVWLIHVPRILGKKKLSYNGFNQKRGWKMVLWIPRHAHGKAEANWLRVKVLQCVPGSVSYSCLQNQLLKHSAPWVIVKFLYNCKVSRPNSYLTLILPRSRTGTVWFYTSTSNKRAARTKL